MIDVRNNPIQRLRADAIVQADGTFHRVDAIALATGFDAITGGLKNLQIKGVNGKLLSNKWATGTRTYLGLATAGFPNFFLCVPSSIDTSLTKRLTEELQHLWAPSPDGLLKRPNMHRDPGELDHSALD